MPDEIRTTTLFNESGDTTIAWDSDKDDEMLAIIEKKMGEGVTFFVVKPRFGGVLGNLLGTTKKRLADVSDLDSRAVSVADKDFAKVLGVGVTSLDSSKENGEVSLGRRATSAREVVSNHTVALRPMQGG